MKLQRNSTIEASPLDGDLLLFNPTLNKFFLMNPTACFLWNALAEPKDEDTLATELCANFDGVTRERALDDVRGVIQDMLIQGLIQVNS